MLRPAGWCWVGLTAGVACADVVLIRKDQETMSEVLGEALRHPAKRGFLVSVWAVLTLHLFAELIPARLRSRLSHLDPIGFLADLCRG